MLGSGIWLEPRTSISLLRELLNLKVAVQTLSSYKCESHFPIRSQTLDAPAASFELDIEPAMTPEA